jgi:hypothetical protein
MMSMNTLNPLETYADVGRKLAKAHKQHDAGMARHWGDWVARALALEDANVRPIARARYRDAYREESATT